MTGIVAAWNVGSDASWANVIGEHRAPGAQIFSWRHSTLPLRVAAVARTDALYARDDDLVLALDASPTAKARALAEDYERRGPSAFAEVEGELSFILWDRRRATLFVACDAVGVRAPAYFWDGHTLVVATRAVALLRHPAVPRSLDPTYASAVLSGLWTQPRGTTAFSRVQRLQGGQALVLKDGRFHTETFAKLDMTPRPIRTSSVTISRARRTDVARARAKRFCRCDRRSHGGIPQHGNRFDARGFGAPPRHRIRDGPSRGG